MKWEYFNAEWTALSSKLDEDGHSLKWSIVIRPDGRFRTANTRRALLQSDHVFHTLAEAKAFCERIENDSRPVIDHPPVEEKPVNVFNSWFSKRKLIQ